jgi:hypothetical protein
MEFVALVYWNQIASPRYRKSQAIDEDNRQPAMSIMKQFLLKASGSTTSSSLLFSIFYSLSGLTLPPISEL